MKSLVPLVLLILLKQVESQGVASTTNMNAMLRWDFFTRGNNLGAYFKESVVGAAPTGPRLQLGVPGIGTTTPAQLDNGLIFEGEEAMVVVPVVAPATTKINLGKSFSISFWVYIAYINGIHTLFCRQQPTALVGGVQLCLKYDATQFWFVVKDSSPGGAVSIALGDPAGLNTVYLSDMLPRLGWQFLHFNIYQENTINTFGGYYATDTWQSYNQSFVTFPSTYLFTDDPVLNNLVVGAEMTSNLGIKDLFLGIINQITIYTKPMGRFQVHDQYTYKCQPYCNLCKVFDMPKCIQQIEKTLLVYYDFAPPKFEYPQPQPVAVIPIIDLMGAANLNSLAIDTFASEPTNAAGPDPVYVDRQGLWFEYAGKSRTAGGVNTATQSITWEAWVRPISVPFPNNANIAKIAGASTFGIQFSNIPEMIVNINGILFKNPVTMVNKKWYYVVGSIFKISNLQSWVCMYYYNLWSCKVQNQLYTAGGGTITIGGGFIGIINKVKLFQWPKVTQEEAMHNVRLYSNKACLDFNGGACQECDIEDKGPDTNFKYRCKSTCNTDQYMTDCRQCHALCRTCFDYTEYHCFSCFDTDMDYHTLGNRCVQQCGLGKTLGYYECDDGNLVNGDGCTSNCKPEKGYVCSNFPTTSSVCKEKCGDGRRTTSVCPAPAPVGCIQCDDDNTLSGDGCSSTCTVEPGYACFGGGLQNRDLCYEICGDGKNLFSYECDDNNVISGDGCSAGCKVELGFKCVGGSPTTKDVCTEICGDGMPRGVLGCDDGNLVNGDGCDKTCTVEYGWKCFSPNKIVSSFCYKISWPNIVDFWLANGNNNLYIKFNETIAVDKNWNETDWSLSIDGPVGPYNFTWDLYQKGALITTPQQTIIINLTISSQIYGYETLKFDFNFKNTTLSGLYKTMTQSDGFSIALLPQDDPLSGSCGIESIRIPIFGMLYVNIGLALASAAMMQTTTVMFHLMGNLQICKNHIFLSNLYLIVSLAIMYEAAYPTCLVNFLKSLTFISINFRLFGGDIFSGFVNQTSFPYSPPDYKFTRVGKNSSSILYNSGDLIFFWLLLLLIFLVFVGLEFVFNAIPYVRTISQRFRHNFFNAGMNFVFIKMAFDSCFAMFYIKFDNNDQLLSSAAAIGMSAMTLFYPAYVGYHAGVYAKEIDKSETPNKIDSVRGNHIFSEYDPGHPACYNYLVSQCVKKAIFVAIALLMYNIQCFSLLLSAIVQLGFLIYYSYVRPFRQPLFNVAIIYEEFVTLLCFVVLFKFANVTNVNDMLKSHGQVKIFAGLVAALTVAPAIMAIVELIRSLKYFKQICNWQKDVMEIKGDFDSSEDEKVNQSEDLLKNQVSEDSLVEKSITVSSGDERQYYIDKSRTDDDEPSLSPREERKKDSPSSPKVQDVEDESEGEPVPEKKPPPKTQTQMGSARNSQQPPPQQTQAAPLKEKTPPPPLLSNTNFDSIDFSTIPDAAANTKDRLPQLSNRQ